MENSPDAGMPAGEADRAPRPPLDAALEPELPAAVPPILPATAIAEGRTHAYLMRGFFGSGN